MKKIAYITGAKGFLGRYCARYFASQDWKVAGIGNGAWLVSERAQWGTDFWLESLVTTEALENLARQTGTPSAIIHCAGGSSVGASYQSPKEDFDRTVSSTVEVLEFARRQDAPVRVIYPSSAAVYGAATDMPMKEEAPLVPVSPYGLHKVQAEQCCRMYAQEWGVPVAIVRFFSLYGAGLRKQLLWDACQKAVTNEFVFFGEGRDVRDWLYVSDAVRLVELAVQQTSPDCPIVNGGTGVGVPICEILKYLGSIFSPKQKPLFSGQAKLGDPAYQIADTTRLDLWGFKATVSWQDGVRAYADWFILESRP
ncbi:MAG: SDR family oxidoreductase [Desulfovibrio sp.]|jgi:UDP-glucose 4-epimerase|nr:SDR family oxidoreductase [Desulfovibrio sp.]